jgi:hypothetical protein
MHGWGDIPQPEFGGITAEFGLFGECPGADLGAWNLHGDSVGHGPTGTIFGVAIIAPDDSTRLLAWRWARARTRDKVPSP